MARFFALFTLFHLSLTFFRPEVPFNPVKTNTRLYGEKAIYFCKVETVGISY